MSDTDIKIENGAVEPEETLDTLENQASESQPPSSTQGSEQSGQPEKEEIVDVPRSGPGSISPDEIGPEDQEAEAEVEDVDPLEKAQEENKKIREQMLRLAADFDNYRKRSRKENEDAARRAKMDVLRELLPVFDNMERAVAHAEQAKDVAAVATGVQMVVKQFQDTIGGLGVQRVKSLGQPFDPNVHEAIQQLETAEQDPGTVVAEMLPGYVLGERLLRAAMVVVAKSPPEPTEQGEDSAPTATEDSELEAKSETKSEAKDSDSKARSA
ncbi:MAG: nucleotide exchange factor GrpE [Sorangium cellulosum]|nr:MAG: nucleotide exchange factor GrpE [Sorangium cellulosum]